jgi:hypothetical protein
VDTRIVVTRRTGHHQRLHPRGNNDSLANGQCRSLVFLVMIPCSILMIAATTSNRIIIGRRVGSTLGKVQPCSRHVRVKRVVFVLGRTTEPFVGLGDTDNPGVKTTFEHIVTSLFRLHIARTFSATLSPRTPTFFERERDLCYKVGVCVCVCVSVCVCLVPKAPRRIDVLSFLNAEGIREGWW